MAVALESLATDSRPPLLGRAGEWRGRRWGSGRWHRQSDGWVDDSSQPQHGTNTETADRLLQENAERILVVCDEPSRWSLGGGHFGARARDVVDLLVGPSAEWRSIVLDQTPRGRKVMTLPTSPIATLRDADRWGGLADAAAQAADREDAAGLDTPMKQALATAIEAWSPRTPSRGRHGRTRITSGGSTGQLKTRTSPLGTRRETERSNGGGKKKNMAATVATNMAGRGTDIMLGGNAEFLAVQEDEGQGLTQEIPEEYEAEWDAVYQGTL